MRINLSPQSFIEKIVSRFQEFDMQSRKYVVERDSGVDLAYIAEYPRDTRFRISIQHTTDGGIYVEAHHEFLRGRSYHEFAEYVRNVFAPEAAVLEYAVVDQKRRQVGALASSHCGDYRN